MVSDSVTPLHLGEDAEGRSILAVPHDPNEAKNQVKPITSQLGSTAETEAPESDEGPGPVTRATDKFSPLPAATIRRLVLNGAESAEAIRTRRDELYRNTFPRIVARYEVKCDDCGAEYDDEHDECPACGSGDLSEPDEEKKREAKRLFESVNPAGQSLRDVMKRAEPDQWTAGVSTLVITHKYYQATTGSLYREGEIYKEEPTAIYRADPINVRPIVDENGQPGGVWICPIHREEQQDEQGRCSTCGARLREAHFKAEYNSRDETYYLRHEVVTWAYPHPRLQGLDGLSPSIHTWLKQVILKMMDRYAGAFYDQNSDRLPNQFMILHTSNPDHWEDEMAKARGKGEDGDGDPYKSPVFTNEYNSKDNSQPEVQVIDAMPDELLGQSEDTKDAFKKDIRQAYGISDIHDSDLKDAGGLNNEGLQLEVVDRSLASQMNDYREGPLDTIMKRLGFDGWRIEFLPNTGDDPDQIQDNLKAAAFVKQAGGDAEIVDGNLRVTDFEVDLDDSDDPPSLQGQPNLPGVGSPVPDAGGGPGGGGPGGGAAGGGGGLDTSALAETVSHLEAMETKARWGVAVGMKGAPVYTQRNDVPPNVQQNVESAIDQYDFSVVESVSTPKLKRIFKKRLTQPQGWSIDSLANALESEGVDPERVRDIARTEATGILNQAREDALARLDENIDDEVLHYWDGPQDEDTTEICTWLKEQTNPEYGGEPVTMEELKDLQREAIDKFGGESGSGSIRNHILHVNERHTHRAILRNDL